VGADLGPERDALASTLSIERPSAPAFLRSRPYRVLTYRWHVPHQYELYKLPFEFTLLTGLGSPMTESWEFGQRPMPPNARFARADSIDPSDYDFAILHFDENVLAPENTNGVIGQDWGAAFRWFRENVGIPKVAVCHGTPQFRGMYNFDYRGADLMQVIEPARRQLVDYLADIPVVCNSHQARAEWQFRKSRVIWHGFDPAEFPPATYERGIVSPLGPLVMSRPHYRGYFLYRQVFDGHFDELRPETLRVPEPHVAYSGNAYAAAKYRNYVDELRRYTVYFNPTLRSPMPRARTEPMMCGVVPVSARNHDVDMFVENGVNGFYGETAEELREHLRYLMRNPAAARAMGKRARETAMRVFNSERFLGEWVALAREVAG
jgi:glycosyltransferase involved in cell wall biosynthesis